MSGLDGVLDIGGNEDWNPLFLVPGDTILLPVPGLPDFWKTFPADDLRSSSGGWPKTLFDFLLFSCLTDFLSSSEIQEYFNNHILEFFSSVYSSLSIYWYILMISHFSCNECWKFVYEISCYFPAVIDLVQFMIYNKQNCQSHIKHNNERTLLAVQNPQRSL
jgi:hypothetical protein